MMTPLPVWPSAKILTGKRSMRVPSRCFLPASPALTVCPVLFHQDGKSRQTLKNRLRAVLSRFLIKSPAQLNLKGLKRGFGAVLNPTKEARNG